jgi:hypothetical protein
LVGNSTRGLRDSVAALPTIEYAKHLSGAMKSLHGLLIMFGNSLTAVGCSGLVLALSGLINADLFAIGISSGIRIIGSVAITGCLLSAVGYGIVDHLEE